MDKKHKRKTPEDQLLSLVFGGDFRLTPGKNAGGKTFLVYLPEVLVQRGNEFLVILN